MADSSIEPPKKKTRGATMLPLLTCRRQPGYKFPIQFDARLDPIGEFAVKFKSYVALLARSKASILSENWKNVDAGVKNNIWSDILETFDIPNDETLKNHWIRYAGDRWTEFKSSLTRRYVYPPDNQPKNPCETYDFITAETWELFVKSREEEKFQAKREKGKELQSQCNFYHTSSRGGYKMIKENWKKNYVEARREESGDPDMQIDPPSPPRHELFKLAHQRKTGSFSTEKSASVALKIDELVDQTRQGTFVPDGRKDILAVAVGKPDHRGRVLAVGNGVGLSEYFGRASRTSSTSDAKLAAMKQKLTEELTEKLTQEFEEKNKAMIEEILSQKLGLIGGYGNDYMSPKNTNGSKGSCAPSHVEEPLKNDWLKELHSLTFEITEEIKLDLDHEEQQHFYIGYKDILAITKGDSELGMNHMAIWCTYLHRECKAMEISDVYGFLDPYKISHGYKQDAIQTYIQNKLYDQNKTCFLAPYLFKNHWQLFVVCPNANTVVWMCSLHLSPSDTLVKTVQKAMDGYHRLKGNKKPKPQWVTLKGPKQNDGYTCGYYVMINMMTIVSATITDSWTKMFNTSCPFTPEQLKDVRQLWAEFFIKLYADRKPTSREERRNQV